MIDEHLKAPGTYRARDDRRGKRLRSAVRALAAFLLLACMAADAVPAAEDEAQARVGPARTMTVRGVHVTFEEMLKEVAPQPRPRPAPYMRGPGPIYVPELAPRAETLSRGQTAAGETAPPAPALPGGGAPPQRGPSPQAPPPVRSFAGMSDNGSTIPPDTHGAAAGQPGAGTDVAAAVLAVPGDRPRPAGRLCLRPQDPVRPALRPLDGDDRQQPGHDGLLRPVRHLRHQQPLGGMDAVRHRRRPRRRPTTPASAWTPATSTSPTTCSRWGAAASSPGSGSSTRPRPWPGEPWCMTFWTIPWAGSPGSPATPSALPRSTTWSARAGRAGAPRGR